MKHRLALQLSPTKGPRYLQIAAGVAKEIERGRLRPGDQLPSIRQLAAQLKVQRKTVVAGLVELEAQGWICRRARSGVFVAEQPADLPALTARAIAEVAGFDLPPDLPPRPTSLRREFDLLGGVPDLSQLPKRELARAYRRVLARDRTNALIDYGDPRGHPRLREALAEWLVRTRGVRATPDTLNVVRGVQNGLYLAARALLPPNAVVAIEAYAHPSIVALLRLVGVELVPIPLDGDGLDVDALDALCRVKPVRALYTTPHHQLPTTVTLSAGRRSQLLELARRRRFMIWEDDYDHEYQYAGAPVMPLAYADRHGLVIYFGTLSKIVAPGLRTAFVAAVPAVTARLAAYRAFVDRQGDQISERALAELLEDGDLERHVRRTHRLYHARRDALIAALATDLPQLRFKVPDGGMAVWVEAPGIDVDDWSQRALARGVSFQPASHFAVGEMPLHFARLGFAARSESALEEAVRRLAKALPPRRARQVGIRS